MKTVGQILRERRLAKKLSVSDVESATKIRAKFIDAIERDDFVDLPSLNYAKGFVKNYSEFLELNSKNVMAFFRRQTTEIPRSAILPKDIPDTLKRSPLRLTPARFIGLVVGTLIVSFLGYFLYQYQSLGRSPVLTVSEPLEGAIVHAETVDVIGQTDKDATVTINGISVLVRSDGKFFDKVTLSSGENTIVVISTSRFGKATSVERNIRFEPLK